ncbi:TPA: hypothetical protein EYO77_17780 [Candidatus Poribacteria bacterium]|nr:hypothetical protein [Candidatus Poribacteria bacterium]
MNSSNKVNGYQGIWFTLGQFFEEGDKYSGGLGTYTAKLPIQAPLNPKAIRTNGPKRKSHFRLEKG